VMTDPFQALSFGHANDIRERQPLRIRLVAPHHDKITHVGNCPGQPQNEFVCVGLHGQPDGIIAVAHVLRQWGNVCRQSDSKQGGKTDSYGSG